MLRASSTRCNYEPDAFIKYFFLLKDRAKFSNKSGEFKLLSKLKFFFFPFRYLISEAMMLQETNFLLLHFTRTITVHFVTIWWKNLKSSFTDASRLKRLISQRRKT